MLVLFLSKYEKILFKFSRVYNVIMLEIMEVSFFCY